MVGGLLGRGLGAWWVWLLLGGVAWAGGPRWVTGPPYFTTAGVPVVWYTDAPKYFTDPGDLSATVDHAAADALVAAAAAVWNVPTSRLVLAQGGVLAEQVSGANTYGSATGVVFPADVQAGNYLSVQIAVVYDRDGSVTDLLLGQGASDPSGCRQNGVTESVDSIVPSGWIEHAVLVVNGRCTGSAAEMQTQLQYQLMRAFGRVLGLGWSQLNDNVFTGSPVPTYEQELHWPVMHPIDIVCGPYTYQCMAEPFVLRPDDLAALAQLYFIGQGQAGPGETDTLLQASEISGRLSFPDGQGMQGVNVVGRRLQQYWSVPEDWDEVSSVSGYLYRRTNGSAVTGVDGSLVGSLGSLNGYWEGYYNLGRVPLISGDWQQVVLSTEAVNPLYTGQYAVGPYGANTVEPSGANAGYVAGLFSSYANYGWFDMLASTAVASCKTGGDGTENAPSGVAASGWWRGTLCGYGHTAWWTVAMKAGRSLALEVTAVDEQGYATAVKAMPVMGVWQAGDAVGSAPTVAAVTGAFNGTVAGMTQLAVQSTQPEQLRIAIADERGDGRPDFGYQGRVLYADAVSPAQVAASGGVVTITGMGFRAGSKVSVNGVAAVVQSWSTNSLVVTVPSTRSMGVTTALVADVAVQDGTTGGVTVMSGALTYAAPLPERLRVVSAPAGGVTVGTVAGAAWAVKVTEMDGVTPVVGEAIVFSSTGGSGSAVLFGACGGASCTVMTDAQGMASTSVTPLVVDGVVVTATGFAGSVSAGLTGVAAVRTMTVARAVEYMAAGAVVGWQLQVQVADNSAPVLGVGVEWSVGSGAMGLGVSGLGAVMTTADGTGVTSVLATVGPLVGGGAAVGSACAWGTVCVGFGAQGVAAGEQRLEVVSGGGQVVGVGVGLGPVVVRVTDGVGHPVSGAVVMEHETVTAGDGTCPARGRCPAAPVLEEWQGQATSDGDGLVSVAAVQTAGVEVTHVALAVGTAGFVAMDLVVGR